jgi:hypothetical protein
MDEIVMDTLSEPAAESPDALEVAAETSALQQGFAQPLPENEIAAETQEAADETPAPPLSVAQASPDAAVPLPEVSACRTVGPMESKEQADRLAAALARQATRISRQQQTESVIDSYMVMTPLQPTPEATEQLKARLRDKGIKDVYVLPRGENKNRISLGVYKKKSWAERRKAQLAEAGFQVQVGVRTKSQPRYWLNVEMTADNANELDLLKTVDQVAPERKLTLGPCSGNSHLAETAESEEVI